MSSCSQAQEITEDAQMLTSFVCCAAGIRSFTCDCILEYPVQKLADFFTPPKSAIAAPPPHCDHFLSVSPHIIGLHTRRKRWTDAPGGWSS